ncbi:hypothetical protein Mmc1_0035 [Magnetococcus marinus MC-1]|uniref:Lipoprotein n=1 Tax=Magnetococcus marinus (strain ATCC BAA-1437 / JCM 17883 / MC-1) TaxID=156889 RepID=A0L3M1_MAGMM|nr:hypothetical protein [Magnetococcus marinus]ABK42564.1 hypothetical protein Mmc1_0035 [Magnetococcus marinus MC-1]
MLSPRDRFWSAALSLLLLAGCSDSSPPKNDWEPFVESYLEEKQRQAELPADYYLTPERWNPLLDYLGWSQVKADTSKEHELVIREGGIDMGPEEELNAGHLEGGGLLEDLKRKIHAGREALGIVDETMGDNPELLDALRDGGVREALKGVDHGYLEQKKQELMGLAESAGVDADYQPSELDRQVLKGFGKKLGLSDKRMENLEDQAENYRDKRP